MPQIPAGSEPDGRPKRDRDGLWVFGYGSLMWRPGFAHQRAVHARLTGYSRSFCVYTMHHRGTAQRPGLVLGLDRGGVCEGMAFQVAPADIPATLAYLTAREQVSGAYRESLLPITLLQIGRPEVVALAYAVERSHPNYAGRLPLARQAHLIRGAQGLSGTNLDYLISTLAHLRSLGIRERDLERIEAMAGPHAAHMAKGRPTSPSSRALLRACDRLPFHAPRLTRTQRTRFTHRKNLARHAV